MKKVKIPVISVKLLLQPTTICVFINILMVVFVWVVSNNLPPVVPLYYGRPEATDQLAPKTFLALPAAIATIVVILNFFLAKIIRDSFLKQVLIALTIVVTLLSTITIIKIAFLVGNL